MESNDLGRYTEKTIGLLASTQSEQKSQIKRDKVRQKKVSESTGKSGLPKISSVKIDNSEVTLKL